MKSRKELKKEIIERIKNDEPKEFVIKKVELSEDYKELIIEQCNVFTFLQISEEVEKAGLENPGRRKHQYITYRKRLKGKFFGIQIGWWY